MGISDLVQFYLVDKSDKGGMYGCFESHIKVIKDAYEKGLNNILIFEDDIIPTISYSVENILCGINFMTTHDWDIFYYGYFPINEGYANIFQADVVHPNIIKYRPNATHAYCINRSGMKKILEKYNDYIGKIHIDEYISMYLDINAYCLVPMLFVQYLCLPHDNEGQKLSHFMARKLQCVVEKTHTLYIVSWLVWLYNSVWWFVLLCVIITFILIAKP
jgi:hypothetical protein